MALAFKDYLKRFDVKLLMLASEGIVPADLLREKKDGLFKVGRAMDVVGSLGDYLNCLESGNMINGEIEETRNFGGGATLPLLGGLVLKGGLKNTRKAITTITEVKCRVLDVRSARSAIQIMSDLLSLKNTDKQKWKQVNNKWFVVQCWYATKFTVTLTGTKDLEAKAEVKEVKVDGTSSWVDKNILDVVSNPSVPFGVNALKL